jgi:hypothetical protein
MDDWLRQAGYEYDCFISWPHTANADITKCARRLKQEIESRLAAHIDRPKVFLDEAVLAPGDDWPNTIKHALCRSLTMVAVCAPIYFGREHKWCGLEWATMQLLSDVRLVGLDFHAIIPVIIRKSMPLPAVFTRIQYTDFTGIATQSHYYFLTNEFRKKAQDIVEKILLVAEAIKKNRAEPNCDKLEFPTVSAFDGYVPAAPQFPFH